MRSRINTLGLRSRISESANVSFRFFRFMRNHQDIPLGTVSSGSLRYTLQRVIDVSAVRVLVIDNSIFLCDELADGLRQHLPPGSLVEKTTEPVDALEKVSLFHPDVIVLNYTVSQIQINGQRLLSLLREHPDIPIITFGFLPKEKTTVARFGISDYVTRPMDANSKPMFHEEIANCVLQAARTQKASSPAAGSPSTSHPAASSPATSLRPGAIMTRASWKQQRMASPGQSSSAASAPPAAPLNSIRHSGRKIELIAIGSSTGGTEALSTILKELSPPMPGIVITQHIPPLFAKLFAKRLDDECKLRVKEASNGDQVEHDTVYIAPGNLHMTVYRSGGSIMIACGPGPKVHSCRPSVDVLFDSVAANIGDTAAGIILTGMGHDGAAGLLKMRKAGSPTLGQNEATCVVYGMPKAAWEMGAVEHQLPLTSIASAITQLVRQP